MVFEFVVNYRCDGFVRGVQQCYRSVVLICWICSFGHHQTFAFGKPLLKWYFGVYYFGECNCYSFEMRLKLLNPIAGDLVISR